MNKKALIEALQLQPHIEGGYYKRTYNSPHSVTLTGPEKKLVERSTMSSIYYMLTSDSPLGHTHKNHSDIIRYYQLGQPLRYLVLFPDGCLEETILGPNIAAGHKLQLLTPGGTWVSVALVTSGDIEGDFGLVSEAVTPGFDSSDRELATADDIQTAFSQHWTILKFFIKP